MINVFIIENQITLHSKMTKYICMVMSKYEKFAHPFFKTVNQNCFSSLQQQAVMWTLRHSSLLQRGVEKKKSVFHKSYQALLKPPRNTTVNRNIKLQSL